MITRWILRGLFAILGVAALTYAGDSAVFVLRGNPASQVIVNRYLAVPLKGNKVEYDFQGTEPIPCARALFSQNGSTPCWYLRRHTNEFQKI